MSRVKAEFFDDCQRMNFLAEQYQYCQLEEQQARELLLSNLGEVKDALSVLRSSIEYEIDKIVLEGASYV